MVSYSDIYKILLFGLIVEFGRICAQNELDTETSDLGLTITAVENVAKTNFTSSIFYEVENNTSIDLSSQSNIYAAESPAKVQKCCGINEELYIDSTQRRSVCRPTTDKFLVTVFTFNQTHYWNYTDSNRLDVEIYVHDPCTEIKIFLDPIVDINDTFRLLNNGSLYIPAMYLMHDLDKYCLDILHDENRSFVTAMVCEAAAKPNLLHYFFGAGQIISFISLILLAIYSMRRKDIDEDHKKCLAWFSTVRALAFLVAIINTFAGAYLHENVIILMGYIFFYLTLNYYLWLNMLCWDTRRCVEHGNENSRVSQMPKFFIVVFLLPLLLLLVSLINFGNPALPQIYMSYNESSSMRWCIFLFILPITFSHLSNLIICTQMNLPKMRPFGNTRSFINHITARNWKPPPSNIVVLQHMYRRSIFLFSLLGVMWIFDLVMLSLPTSENRQANNMIHDVITSLQGLFVALLFVRKEWFDCKAKNDEACHQNHELQPMNNGGTTSI